MDERERFLAVARFQRPDYVPIFGFPGAPGMSGGCLKTVHDRLVATGMPARVGGSSRMNDAEDLESWQRYWGAGGPITLDFSVCLGVEAIRSVTRIENGREIVEDECGALTRQVIDNDITYSMPEFIRYRVRDRQSWEFYRDRMTPRRRMPADQIEANCLRFDRRDWPLAIGAGGAYGFLRDLMGPEALSLAFYDDPQLIHDIMAWRMEQVSNQSFALIERLRPEVVQLWEDLSYNHGMLLSPALFREFCGPSYAQACGCARAAGVAVIAVDCDGNVMEFAPLAAEYGVNAMYPFEVKAGNDLFALREKLPDFVFFGWLEKEVVNEGNERLIGPEILGKVPPLLGKGGYFPNGDHGLQPTATFRGLCRFMTILHESCGNPEGEFPRM